MKRYLPFIIIVVVLVAVVAIFSVTLRKRNGGNEAKPDLVNTNQAALVVSNTPVPNQATPDSAGLTKPNVKLSSPVVLEEYGDYQCPPCGQLYPELKQVEKEYGNQLQIVFHNFPLTRIHKNAMAAAVRPRLRAIKQVVRDARSALSEPERVGRFGMTRVRCFWLMRASLVSMWTSSSRIWRAIKSISESAPIFSAAPPLASPARRHFSLTA